MKVVFTVLWTIRYRITVSSGNVFVMLSVSFTARLKKHDVFNDQRKVNDMH